MVENDRLAIEDHGRVLKLMRLGRDRGKARGPVIAAARDDPHPAWRDVYG